MRIRRPTVVELVLILVIVGLWTATTVGPSAHETGPPTPTTTAAPSTTPPSTNTTTTTGLTSPPNPSTTASNATRPSD